MRPRHCGRRHALRWFPQWMWRATRHRCMQKGRAAKGLVERARAQVAASGRVQAARQVVFTGSATEAAALAVGAEASVMVGNSLQGRPTEHDCLKRLER